MPANNKTDDLEAMDLDALRAKYTELTGEETKDRSKKRLIEKIRNEQQSVAAVEKPKDEADDEPAENDGEEKAPQMTIEELREKHLELIGRPTKSSNRRYLLWRLAQAEKGKIPTGPRSRAAKGPQKVLPVRVPEAAVEPVKDAKTRLGLRSRNDLFLKAIHAYLAENGEDEVAALFADDE